jgi:hypothetical protein
MVGLKQPRNSTYDGVRSGVCQINRRQMWMLVLTWFNSKLRLIKLRSKNCLGSFELRMEGTVRGLFYNVSIWTHGAITGRGARISK